MNEVIVQFYRPVGNFRSVNKRYIPGCISIAYICRKDAPSWYKKQSEEYRTKELEKRIAELEAALGRKQMELDLLNKVLDLASKDLQIDLKKNLSDQPSSGSVSKKG